MTYKTLFTLTVALFSFTISAFSQTDTVRTDIYKIIYSSELEQPTKIFYEITCPHGNVSREGKNFYVPDSIHTSDDDDYYDNIYDKGHMVPAAAFSCTEESLDLTFSYLNSALQHQSLNRGVWRYLEEFERNLAVFYPNLLVEIEVIFLDDQTVDGGATIPTAFIKTLYFDGKIKRFRFLNEDTKGTHFMDYLITEDN